MSIGRNLVIAYLQLGTIAVHAKNYVNRFTIVPTEL